MLRTFAHTLAFGPLGACSLGLLLGVPATPSHAAVGQAPSLIAYPGLSYYSGEATGRFTVACSLSDDEFEKRRMALSLEVLAPDGKPALNKEWRRIENQGVVAEFPAGEWRPGIYPVTVRLLSAGGEILALMTSRIRIEPPPPPGISVSKVDHERMCLLVNGKPYFPIGFLSLAGFDKDSAGTDLVRKYAGGGVNTIVEWRSPGRSRAGKNQPWTTETDSWLAGNLDACDAEYRRAHEAGVGVIPKTVGHISISHNNVPINTHDQPLIMAKLPVVIERLKRNPGLVAWQSVDEQSWEIIEMAREQCSLIRRLDPHHVLWASGRGVPSAFYDACDIYGVHAYWGPEDGPNKFATRVLGGYQTAKMVRCPIFATPQGQRLTYSRDLTPDERRAGLYLGLINGAKAMLLFAYPHPAQVMHDVTWRVVSYASREMALLAPILVEPAPPQNVVMTRTAEPGAAELPPLPPLRTLYDPSFEGKRGPGADKMPLLQALVHDLPGGGEVILAANSGKHPLRVSFALSSLGPNVRVRGYFTKKEYPVAAGTYHDDLEAYGVRIYETLGSARPRGAPVSLGVRVAVLQRAAKTEEEPPFLNLADQGVTADGREYKIDPFVYTALDDLEQVRTEKPPVPGQNILRNSGFEECTLPGMPDCWLSPLWKSRYFLDDEAKDGRHSLALLPHGATNVYYQYWRNWRAGQTYTLSFYARAEVPGSVLRIMLDDMPTWVNFHNGKTLVRDFRPAAGWERYEWTFTVPADSKWMKLVSLYFWNLHLDTPWSSHPEYIRPPENERPKVSGKVWVDSLQLELGERATPYRADDYRAVPIDPKWLSDDVFGELPGT